MDLAKMTSAELRQLHADVDKALVEREKRDRAEAKAAAENAAAEFGFTLSELLADRKSAKYKAATKYRNPDNPDQTWSGRGRKPDWLVSALKAGRDLSDLEI